MTNLDADPLTVRDLQRVPPSKPSPCGVCGAFVANVELHRDWHLIHQRLLAQTAQTETI